MLLLRIFKIWYDLVLLILAFFTSTIFIFHAFVSQERLTSSDNIIKGKGCITESHIIKIKR